MAKVFDEIEITKEDGTKVKMKILFTFENATYNKQGFAQATHDAMRMVDRFGKTQKIMFFPKLSSQTMLEKSLNLLKRVITKH